MRLIEKVFLAAVAYCSRIGEEIGMYTYLRSCNQEKITVLMYHGVTLKHNFLLNFDHKHVEKEKFEKQLQYLKQNYSLLNLDEFYDIFQGKQEKVIPRNPLLITFDDGYANNYNNAFPLLKKYNVPAVIFLPTAYIGKKAIAWYDTVTYCIALTKKSILDIQGKQYTLLTDKQKIAAISELKQKCRDVPQIRELFLKEIVKQTGVEPSNCTNEDLLFMTWEQCQEMQNNSITFESHSISHNEITLLNEEDIKQEMKQSKKIIKKKLNKSCIAFAHPFGSYNEKVQKLLRKTEYTLGFTTVYGINTHKTDTLQLKRIAVNNKYELPIFTLNLYIHFQALHHMLIVLYSKLRKCVGY